MKNLIFTSMAALLLATVPAAGQTTAAQKAKTAAARKGTWSPPRAADGQRDLEGAWTNNSVTPLQDPTERDHKAYDMVAELAQDQQREHDLLALDGDDGEPP